MAQLFANEAAPTELHDPDLRAVYKTGSPYGTARLQSSPITINVPAY